MRPLRPEIARSVRNFPYVAAACLAYFLSIRWGHGFVIQPELVAAFWPPAGVLTAVFLLTDSRAWPLIFGGALLTNLVACLGVQHPLLADVVHAAFDCAQCLGIAYLSRRFLDPPVLFDSFRQLAGFALISVICSGLGTGLGAALLQGNPGAGSFREIWRICWVSHTFGLLLVTPAVLSWHGALRAETDHPLRERVAEGVLYLAAVLGVALYSFTGAPGTLPLLRLRSYVVFPLLIWGAVRFGIRGAASGSLIAVSVAVYCTSVGIGPFVLPGEPVSEELLALQFFMGTAILSSLLLAALNHEQRKSLKEIEERNRELTILHRISEIASDSHAKGDAVDRIAEAIGSLAGFRYVTIELFDGFRERLHLEGAMGVPVPERGEGGKPDLWNPLSLEVARSGKAVVETRSAERAVYRNEMFDRLGIRTILCVPMSDGEKVVGVLTLGHTGLLAMEERPPGWIRSIAATIAVLVDRRRSHDALRASEERFRAIADYTYDWENWVGPDGSVKWVNPAVERISGYTPAECAAMPDFPLPLLHPEDVEKAVPHLAAARGGASGDGLEVRIRRKDGGVRWVSVSWQPIIDAGGNSLGHRSSVRDITKRKLAEEELRRYKAELEVMVAHRTKELRDANALLEKEVQDRLSAEASLRESESRFRGMYNNALHGIAIFDPVDGMILEANRQFHDMVGHADSQLSGKSWFRMVHREDGKKAQDHLQALSGRALDTPVREYRFLLNGGGVRWGRVAFSRIPGKSGHRGLVAGIVEDVTELHRTMEDLLKYQEELRSLASYLQTAREQERVRIAREIHDELGQMLTALKMDVSLLEGQISVSVPSAQAKLDSMKATLDSTISTVKRIVKELRPNLLDHFGLVAAIEVHLKEFSRRTGIECRAVMRPDGAPLDRELSISIFRVCQEALTNIARHAHASRARVRLTEDAGLLCLTVADNGRGIAPREISDTSSLGLIGIRERVRPLGGEFRIRGFRGRGTVLSVKIPVHPHAMVV